MDHWMAIYVVWFIVFMIATKLFWELDGDD
jgi:hypothetical protein